MYSQPIGETIAKRYSCRSYDGTPVSQADRDALERFIAAEATDHQGKRIKLRLVEEESASGSPIKLGTYGAISGTSLYLAGSIPKDGPSIEGFGFAFEKAILYATELGLASCWLAGNVNRKNFSASMGLSESDIIPAVSPLGHASVKPRFYDSLSRSFAKSRTRDDPALLFFGADGASPLPDAIAARFAAPLEALRLAPSARNKQPWRVMASPAGFRFFVKRDLGYSAVFSFDLQRMDLGIAMCHFHLSAAESGLGGSWSYETGVARGPDGSEYVASWVQG
jgi:nitroreductase